MAVSGFPTEEGLRKSYLLTTGLRVCAHNSVGILSTMFFFIYSKSVFIWMTWETEGHYCGREGGFGAPLRHLVAGPLASLPDLFAHNNSLFTSVTRVSQLEKNKLGRRAN